MNPYQEIFDRRWYGMYRAIIVEENSDFPGNGIYTVRVYPMMADIEDDYLPPAQSNMTTKYGHENLIEDEVVWVFFENGDAHIPIIFDRCNIKDFFPQGANGEEPDWWGDMEANSDIDEEEVSFEGEAGKVWVKTFGENFHILIDEENEVFVMKGSNFWIIMDADGNWHMKATGSYMTFDENFNVAADEMLLMIGDNKIEASTEGVVVNEKWKVLNS